MNKSLDRLVNILVVDRYDRPLSGAEIVFEIDGARAGIVTTDGAGHAMIQIPTGDHGIVVIVRYRGHLDEAKLGDSTDQFRFKLATGAPPMSQYFSAILGLIVMGLGVYLAFSFQEPTLLQSRIILVLISLGGGGVAAAIPGFLQIDMDLWGKIVIGGAGALGVFLILFFFDPLNTVGQSNVVDGGLQPAQTEQGD